MNGINKKAIIFLLSITLLPFMIYFFIYYPYLASTDNKTSKEIIVDHYKKDDYQFKIDTMYIDSQNRGEIALKSKKNLTKYPLYSDGWRNEIRIGDSITKKNGDTKIYVYRNNKLYKILDYNDININE